MCLALISTAHPLYPLILIDNRDEYLQRPTAAAHWWDGSDSHILGGRDLLRPERGTWLGVTKTGRVAVLTNYRDDAHPRGLNSRGAMITSFLRRSADTETSTQQFVEHLVDSQAIKDVGGFSLACGQVGEPLAIVSNRISTKDGIKWIAGKRGQTVALSNTDYGDRSWPKVVEGERKLNAALKESHERAEDEEALIERLLALLSSDDLPRCATGGGLETYVNDLRKTIFVPIIGDEEPPAEPENNNKAVETESVQVPVTTFPEESVEAAAVPAPATQMNGHVKEENNIGMSGPYGTQKQTIILVDGNARIKFFERTLFDDKAKPIPKGQGDRSFEFEVEE